MKNKTTTNHIPFFFLKATHFIHWSRILSKYHHNYKIAPHKHHLKRNINKLTHSVQDYNKT